MTALRHARTASPPHSLKVSQMSLDLWAGAKYRQPVHWSLIPGLDLFGLNSECSTYSECSTFCVGCCLHTKWDGMHTIQQISTSQQTRHPTDTPRSFAGPRESQAKANFFISAHFTFCIAVGYAIRAQMRSSIPNVCSSKLT